MIYFLKVLGTKRSKIKARAGALSYEVSVSTMVSRGNEYFVSHSKYRKTNRGLGVHPSPIYSSFYNTLRRAKSLFMA